MIALLGSAVPSITTFLPFGGGAFSGVVMVFCVGAVWNFASSADAAATPGADAVAAPLDAAESGEPDDPHPASPATTASAPVRSDTRDLMFMGSLRCDRGARRGALRAGARRGPPLARRTRRRTRSPRR